MPDVNFYKECIKIHTSQNLTNARIYKEVYPWGVHFFLLVMQMDSL